MKARYSPQVVGRLARQNGGSSTAMLLFFPLAIILSVPICRVIHWYCHFEQYNGIWGALTDYSTGSYCLPGALLGYFSLAYISRMTRSFMLNELTQEYIVAARAKGHDIVTRAEERSREMYRVANDYSEDVLRRTEEAVQMALDEVKQTRVRFRAASNEQMQRRREELNKSLEKNDKEDK